MSLLDFSLKSSLIAQGITTVIGASGLFINLAEKDKILNTLLKLETLVQIVEASFYILVTKYLKRLDLNSISKLRYADWVLTTPMMLLSTVVYMIYNTTKPASLMEIIKDNKKPLIRITVCNLCMLLCGLLGEYGIIDKFTATILGFAFFGCVFNTIYKEYTKQNKKNLVLFWFTCIVWALYGVVYLFNSLNKNIAYNILDVIAKNFYGLFILYEIYLKRN
jgi:bacteriorhodopsin